MEMTTIFNENNSLSFRLGGKNKTLKNKVIELYKDKREGDFMNNNDVQALINKAIKTKKLTADELDLIELDDICEETIILGQDEMDDSNWRIILSTGEEIDIELV